MKVLFSGGGTAGHINPALAIANHLKDVCGELEAHFVGTAEGLEVGLIPRSGYPLDLIKVHGFERKLSFGTFKTAFELPAAVAASKRIIKKFKPDIVVGTGGYVCGPVLYAAAKMKIPTFVHESNAFPGITVKILSKYVDEVAVGIDAARKYLPNAKKVVHTGNPVRPEILNVDSFAARRRLRLDSRPFIVIFGGSLGARDFNAAMADWICSVAKSGKYNILMGTGKLNQYEKVMKRFLDSGINLNDFPDIKVSEYIYDMDIAMNAADLVVSRAGASTLAELTAIGKPAVLVPSPYVTDNHQEHNARAIESGGGARVILESELNVEKIDSVIREITDNPAKLAEMRRASAEMGVPDSADIISREILNLVN
ncbi:MAG: undecaprenyldiphospho-muramoylpentapeptide beta-N-acetylglucosaminyltransferase [Clostridiales bacterium]|nr:undecaprenyldiphospho-muramoylpentapeptide beta-N-acetylglucosaminyltransferase [Clostridiales bacterium]